MFHSKSRSGSSDFVKKNRYSVISRTFSATKLCRGDPLRIGFGRNSTMQRQMGEQLEGELKLTTNKLVVAEEERDKALRELSDTKLLASESNKKLSEELSNSRKELKMRDRNIDLLKVELEKAKEFEVKLAERDASFGRLKEELSNAKASEAQAMRLFSDSKRRIEELEDDFERGKVSETKMYARLVSQTKKLEKTKTQLEESKLEVASLRERTEKMEAGACNQEEADSLRESVDSLRSELELAKENLARAQGGEKAALSKAKNLVAEMNVLKNETYFALAAEEKSRKAMDDLALALTEVATEANQAKEKLNRTELELQCVKQEAEELKGAAKGIEDRYKKLLEEEITEKERFKNTVERLRLEAEESLLAWNDKEIGFVLCIKRAEEERDLAQQENARLIESLKSTGNTTRISREENCKLRDILKQALNEASVAKEAASIAREENSQLKDSNAEKDETLEFLTRENERLRINEAAANESIKALKRLLSVESKKELKSDGKGQNGRVKSAKSKTEEGEDRKKHGRTGRAFSFDLSELNIPNGYEDVNEEVLDEDPIKAEALKGSIFDTVDSPKSAPHTPLHRRVPSSLTDDGKSINSEDSDYLECSSSCEDERNPQRKSRQLLRRFGELVKRKSSLRKEPSIEQ
ncbi:hypothetical protein RHGRI_030042 [Rhododendron griersonianum]|uniref:Uncharacterized protein n=1 Tax=Rhododendron griersonianum TaxID=479676 RepID=A0AAV6ILC9_9ERIC|nr:hypothetical protein RHGRI_030042 [Rhododendron griersonianum]